MHCSRWPSRRWTRPCGRDSRSRVRRRPAGAVRVLPDRRALALCVDPRCQLRRRSGVGAAGPAAHPAVAAVQAVGGARRAHARPVRGAGHRFRRQLADQQRPRGVVPGGTPPAGGPSVCRSGLAGAAGHVGAGPRDGVRRADGPVPRRDLVLDWREQTYPDWTREDVRFIGDSYALSTNVLHYQALRLAERWPGSTAMPARPSTRRGPMRWRSRSIRASGAKTSAST